MKEKFVKFYTKVAQDVSELSYARRLQVGCIIVKDDRIVSIGYNGMPSGWENNCEVEDGWNVNTFQPILKSRPEVMHAERNALDKLTKNGGGTAGAVMFCTHAPCLECAKSIYGSGVTALYYANEYRDSKGLVFLQNCNIPVIKTS